MELEEFENNNAVQEHGRKQMKLIVRKLEEFSLLGYNAV
jgi:hypothetical protein